ncbi:MAG: replication-associated recombination protein A [Polyangiaceae bacterium]|nr:replication-associated recombination protein A [Polyangiaceae bacterium]
MARHKDPDPSQQGTLLGAANRAGRLGGPPAPLAERMRPKQLIDVLGQAQLLGPGRLLQRAIEDDRVPSMILWGPPGSGKTTLAAVISEATKSEYEAFSAVLGGVADLRAILKRAEERRNYQGVGTILFVDEIHRFNKAQQDAFLPHVERGTVTLIGATTENPSFAVNAAVLSRCKVFRLEPLSENTLVQLLQRAASDPTHGLDAMGVKLDDSVLEQIALSANGDARRALGVFEASADLARRDGVALSKTLLERAAEERTLLYDKSGDEHYNVVSALIKSMRGSDPDAAIYWLMRMIDAGDDPMFLLRRLIIFASEDVGCADPRALDVAVNADAAFRRLGMPEGLYPIANACLYLAACPKSGAVGKAFTAARAAIAEHGALPVPKKLRNAPTALMKNEGYGQGYQYPHDQPGNHVRGETYLPDDLVGSRFYTPSKQGLEAAIGERLARLRGDVPVRSGQIPTANSATELTSSGADGAVESGNATELGNAEDAGSVEPARHD